MKKLKFMANASFFTKLINFFPLYILKLDTKTCQTFTWYKYRENTDHI